MFHVLYVARYTFSYRSFERTNTNPQTVVTDNPDYFHSHVYLVYEQTNGKIASFTTQTQTECDNTINSARLSVRKTNDFHFCFTVKRWILQNISVLCSVSYSMNP